MRDNPKDFKKPQNTKSRYRLNEQIRIREVRVIGPDGEQLGVLLTAAALQKAQELELDLIEIAPTARPPVCKIADWGKLRYEMSKKEKQGKQKGQNVKTVQLSANIGENDLARKISDAQRFIDEGHRVLVQVIMKGREAKHSKLVQENTIKKMQAALANATMEQVQLLGLKITATFIRNHNGSKTTSVPSNPAPTTPTSQTPKPVIKPETSNQTSKTMKSEASANAGKRDM